DDLNADDKNRVSQLMWSMSAVYASNEAAVAKIDEEIAADKERENREKRARQEPWTRAHKLQTAALTVSVIVGIIGFSGWYRAAHQSPIHQQQLLLRHQTEQISKEL